MLTGISLNIKLLVDSLKESEAFSFSLLSNSPNPISVYNPDASIRYVNPAFEKLTGFSTWEVVGKKPPYPHWGVKDAFLSSVTFEVKIKEKLTYREEKTFLKKNGDLLIVETAGMPILDTEGNLKYFITNWVDITGHRKLKKPKAERKNFRRSLDDSPWVYA